MKDDREFLDIPDFLRRGYKASEKSKTASNELLGGREAGNDNEVDGELNSRSLGSRECRRCKGRGKVQEINPAFICNIWCPDCGGTGKRSD